MDNEARQKTEAEKDSNAEETSTKVDSDAPSMVGKNEDDQVVNNGGGQCKNEEEPMSNNPAANAASEGDTSSDQNLGKGKPASEKPPLAPSVPSVDRSRPPSLPKRPPPNSRRRHRSHSWDIADASEVRIVGQKSESEVDMGVPVIPSSASAGILEESERLDRLEDEEEFVTLSPDILEALNNPELDEDTPVAAALRANAEVRVSNVSKFARRIKAQNIRRFVKRAALIGKSGNVRGKPPRAPPFRGGDHEIVGGSMPNIYSLRREDDVDDYMDDSSIDSERTPTAGAKTKEVFIESTPAMFQHRSSSQPELPSDLRRKADIRIDSNKAESEEKDNSLSKQPPRAVAGGDGGVPKEIQATPDLGGRAKMHKGTHHLKTWKRRKAKKNRDRRKSYVKGKVIDGEHELYTLSIAVMLGLRTSISMTNTQMKTSKAQKVLDPEDFRHTEKYVFRPKGGPKTPPHQLSHTFKFKDYSPLVFAYMRRMFGVNEYDFLLSVCGNANFIEFISNAKSGQFFFYSYDGKYMIKTMTNAESKFLRQILPHYFRHCARNPNTLLTKFLGMYRVKLYHLRRNVKFVIMNSVFDTDKVIKSLYDLKGSVTGREAKPHQDVKKDNDFRKGRPSSVMLLKPDVRARVREQIVRDCEFFKRMKIMDYSMLVGVHYVPPNQRNAGLREPSRDGSKRKSLQRASHPDSDQERSKGSPSSLPKPSMPVRKGSLGTYKSTGSLGSEAGAYGETSIGAAGSSLDYVFDDDDDNSYLDAAGTAWGSATDAGVMSSATAPSHYFVKKDRNPSLPLLSTSIPFNILGTSEDQEATHIEDIAQKKELTTQQMFWPFHRFYDIHGRRRMVPLEVGSSCDEDERSLKKWDVAPFEPPLSNRKDGGFVMDTTSIETPFNTALANGNSITCDGKVFYFGIIDILQRFNSRKRAEAVMRRYQGSGWQDASCVHPDLYADRFVAFFDECTKAGEGASLKEETLAPSYSGKKQDDITENSVSNDKMAARGLPISLAGKDV